MLVDTELKYFYCTPIFELSCSANLLKLEVFILVMSQSLAYFQLDKDGATVILPGSIDLGMIFKRSVLNTYSMWRLIHDLMEP